MNFVSEISEVESYKSEVSIAVRWSIASEIRVFDDHFSECKHSPSMEKVFYIAIK